MNRENKHARFKNIDALVKSGGEVTIGRIGPVRCGTSGHQGAFRSMFLIKAGLEKEALVATGVVLAVMVDLSRMVIYGASVSAHGDVFNP